jgi:hypothetical protein
VSDAPLARQGRAVLTIVLAVYGYWCLRDPSDYRWIDSLDLAIHETGHLVFGFAGETLALLGGTLFQLIVPGAFIVALWRAGDRHGATVPLWWMAQNCGNISVYIRDARAQELPLVGGGEHDWAILLTDWDRLGQDQSIGDAVRLVGVALYLAAIIGGWLWLPPASGRERMAPPARPR